MIWVVASAGLPPKTATELSKLCFKQFGRTCWFLLLTLHKIMRRISTIYLVYSLVSCYLENLNVFTRKKNGPDTF